MKNITSQLLSLLFVLSAFCACGHKPYPQSLLMADSLADACPDSAIVLLAGMKEAMLHESEAARMYHRLLSIKAADKAGISHTSDSLILPVLHYYIKKNDKCHLPEAYFYAGRVCRDLGDAPQALEYFGKAMEILPENGEHQLKGKIYSQMGTLFAYQSMYDEALKMYKRGRTSGEKLKDSIGMVFKLRDMGNIHNAQNRADSATHYFNEANRLSLLLQRGSLFSMMQSQLAALYDYQQREQENNRLKAENDRQTFWIYVISGGLAIVTLSFIAYRQRSRRKRLELERQLGKLSTIEKENREKVESLERCKAQKEELEQNLANINISENSRQKQQLNRKIELLNHILQQKTIENEQEKEAKERLFSSDIYRKLQERTYSARGEAYVTPEEWEVLKEQLSPAYPAFFERLYSLHTPNENELHVCMLIKLQFRQADIARLLQLAPESIYSIRRRLYKKVTGEVGAPEMWDKIIDSL